MGDWRGRGADHLALVNAYYEGVVRIREATVKPPTAPFFRVHSADSTSANRLRKKRKRQQQQQQQLQELIASGKFVALDPQVVEALHEAHRQVLRTYGWKVNLSSIGRALEAAVHFVDEAERDAGNDRVQAPDVAADSYANASAAVIHIIHNEELCVMPPHSQFLVGDVRAVSRLQARALGRFNFILMDPPWENKSVDRKRSYLTFHHRELLKLPVTELWAHEGDGCVLAIWVTNRPTYSAFILNELLPHCGFTYHATWYWLKVCTNGELVSPLSSPHRLPVEKLVVATRASSAVVSDRLSRELGLTPRVVVSVPLRHSWKPPPESFFDDATLCGRNLEVFARELRPRFVSVGNEPLKFQTAAHFNKGTA
jgi:N6-adenosine-specific RNA methylase IME4